LVVIEHAGDVEYPLASRCSDGQMLLLANMLSKMEEGTMLGSRIAEVHSGSSLFTGDGGQAAENKRVGALLGLCPAQPLLRGCARSTVTR
jgi:type I restriction enzyme M protein